MTANRDEAGAEPCAPRHGPKPVAGYSAAALGSIALAACGGGGGVAPQDANTGVQPKAPDPVEVPQALSPQEDAARFLAQAGFGASAAEIDRLLALKPTVTAAFHAWLDEQFTQPQRTADAATQQQMTLWQLAVAAGYSEPVWRDSDMGLDNVLWFRLFTAHDVLRQRVVLALSEIFVVSVRNMPIPWGQFACLAYWDLLERHAFGNFRELIEAITLSPAMGVYLSMRGSQKGNEATGRRPDENYARELLQLFTIGLVHLDESGQPTTDAQGRSETFTNQDITQLAKVLTGWDMDFPGVPDYTDATPPGYTARPMVPHATLHDESDKTFLGIAIAARAADPEGDLKLALDGICAHPNVGPFLARQLIQRLVASNPEPAHIKRVAAVFNDNGQGVRGDMQAVIRAVLMDPLAREPLTGNQATRRCKLREPVLRFVQWGRLAKLTSTAVAGTDAAQDLWAVGDLSAASRLAQSPLRSPSVFNFFRPGYVPLNSGISSDGFVAPEFQITDESSVIGYANFMLQHIGGAPEQKISVDYSEWRPLALEPAALVDRLNLVLTGRALAQVTVDVIVAAVASLPAGIDNPSRDKRIQAAFFLMLTSPDYLIQR